MPQPTKFSEKNKRDEIEQWVVLSKDEVPKKFLFMHYTVDTTLASTY